MQGSNSNSQLENLPEELQKRLSALLLRNAYVQRAKPCAATTTRQSQKQARELKANDQVVEFDESQGSSSMDSTHDIPIDDAISPYKRLDGAAVSHYPSEDSEYTEHGGEQAFLLPGRMNFRSDHVYNESTQAAVWVPDNFDSQGLDGGNPMEDVQSYTTDMIGAVEYMQLAPEVYATFNHEYPYYCLFYIGNRDRIEGSLHEAPVEDGTYCSGNGTIQDEAYE